MSNIIYLLANKKISAFRWFRDRIYIYIDSTNETEVNNCIYQVANTLNSKRHCLRGTWVQDTPVSAILSSIKCAQKKPSKSHFANEVSKNKFPLTNLRFSPIGVYSL